MSYKRLVAGILVGIHCALAIPMTAWAAAENSLGDPNGDGKVNAEDAAAILADAAAMGSSGTGIFNEQQRLAADTNKNGTADATDAAAILGYAAAYGTGSTKDDFATYLENKNNNTVLDSLSAPKIMVGKKNLAAVISWKPNAYATGYEIYRYDGTSTTSTKYKLITTISGNGISSYTDTLPNNTDSHCYKIRAFRTQSNGTIYSDFSNAEADYTKNAILNAADLEPHNSITVYNRQGVETTSYDYTISEEDIAILEAFAEEHFPENATREEQLWITFQWIHLNVDYAYSGELWDSIAGKSWVEAVFVDQKGQCAQYNGAFASMMAYLGYDVCMVRGYRGTWPSSYWQHYWPEVTIDGTTYMMECGNYGKSGDWYYFLCTYDKTRKYICNQKNMS